jgi:hypothetical protein
MKAYRYLTGKDDAAFCHRVTDALNRGWQLHGQPTLTFDQKRGEVICGQAITKEIEDTPYDPGMDLSKL